MWITTRGCVPRLSISSLHNGANSRKPTPVSGCPEQCCLLGASVVFSPNWQWLTQTCPSGRNGLLVSNVIRRNRQLVSRMVLTRSMQISSKVKNFCKRKHAHVFNPQKYLWDLSCFLVQARNSKGRVSFHQKKKKVIYEPASETTVGT